jgi:hypothetical protein
MEFGKKIGSLKPEVQQKKTGKKSAKRMRPAVSEKWPQN